MSENPPISEPTGKYRLSNWPTVTTESLFLPQPTQLKDIEEPELLVDNIEWQPGSEHNRDVSQYLPAPAVPFKLAVDTRLGDKVTFCVYCFGDYLDIHKRCLESIIKTVPPESLDLRIAAHEVGLDSLNYFRSLQTTKIYQYRRDKPKYAIMRDMFWESYPEISTNYIIWLDDDARVVHSNWLSILANEVEQQPQDVAMYGLRMTYFLRNQLNKDPRAWFKTAGWYRGKLFRTKDGQPAPNGDTIHYCAPWFWIIRTDAVRACGIPCTRIENFGGDVVIGEQLYQGGFKTKNFNMGKALVYTPPQGRNTREVPGKSGRYPWQ